MFYWNIIIQIELAFVNYNQTGRKTRTLPRAGYIFKTGKLCRFAYVVGIIHRLHRNIFQTQNFNVIHRRCNEMR